MSIESPRILLSQGSERFHPMIRCPCLVVRHGKDEGTLTTELNQPLELERTEDVYDFSHEAVSFYKTRAKACGLNGVTILNGPKTRVWETAEICASQFAAEGIPISIHEEPLLRDLHQGKFKVDQKIITGDGKYPPLVASMDAFVAALKSGKIDYHFGDPSGALTEEDKTLISDCFIVPGESKRDISIRIYDFLEQLVFTDPSKMLVIVTHFLVASRIQRISSALSNLVEKGEAIARPGDFVKSMEQTGESHHLVPAQGVMLDLGTLRWAGDRLSGELDFLLHN